VTPLTTMTDDQTRSGFRLLPRGIEENYFKAVPGGWLVAVKRPFGSDWNHFVSDAQKPTLAARLRLAIVVRYTLFIGLSLVAIIGAGRSETPLAVFGLLLAFNACGYLSARSVLRDLPLTSETVTSRDQMRSRADAMSVGALVSFMVICLTAAVGVVAALQTFAIIVVFAVWLGVAIYWLRLLAIKLHALRRDP
jgi:hypothetical protein